MSRRRVSLAVSLTVACVVTDPTSSFSTSRLPIQGAAGPCTITALFAGRVNKKKKPKVKVKKGKNKPATSQSGYQGPKKERSSSKKSAPPWQVLSTKEMKVHVQEEKKRRSNLKSGIEEQPSIVESKKTLSTAFLNDADAKFIKWKRFNPTSVPDSQRFIGAYLGKNSLPPRLGVPEVAFLGRSNVGKSSLLNRLSCRDMARVGKTPGATASVNLYALLDKRQREILGWVDLPGFGYAKLAQERKEAVQQAAETYLSKRRELALGILLVDIRRTPSDDDRAVLAALFDMGVPLVVVATKMDKVSSVNERERQLQTIQEGLGLPPGQPLCVSSVTGQGSRALWRIILDACETCVDEFKNKYDENAEQLVPSLYDEEGDAEEEFEDVDDVVYEQGYDWIHDSAVTYESNDGTYQGGDRSDYEDDFDNQVDGGGAGDKREDPGFVEPQRETLKSLKKRVKEMEKRGEI